MFLLSTPWIQLYQVTIFTAFGGQVAILREMPRIDIPLLTMVYELSYICNQFTIHSTELRGNIQNVVVAGEAPRADNGAASPGDEQPFNREMIGDEAPESETKCL